MNSKFAYTAFDGDDMLYIDLIREFFIKSGINPLNPEHALGYYAATHTLGDSKKEVMRACFGLSSLCNEFWIFTKVDLSKPENICQLSEGILSEMIVWERYSRKDEQKYNPIFKVVSLNDLLEYFINTEKVANGHGHRSLRKSLNIFQFKLTSAEYSNFLEYKYYRELSFFVAEYGNLNKNIFVDIEDKNFKYIDWVRVNLYQQNEVPIIPQCIIPENIYLRYDKSTLYKDAISYLMQESDGILKIVDSRSMIQSHRNNGVKIKTLKDFGLPKFKEIDDWAITTKEKIENLAILNSI